MTLDCRYIGAEQIPVHYGGLRKENDPDFSTKDAASEISVKAGVTETIEIPAPEVNQLQYSIYYICFLLFFSVFFL